MIKQVLNEGSTGNRNLIYVQYLVIVLTARLGTQWQQHKVNFVISHLTKEVQSFIWAKFFFLSLKRSQADYQAHPASYSIGIGTKGCFSTGKTAEVRLTAQLHLVLTLRMSEAVSPLSHMLSWHAQEHLYSGQGCTNPG